MDAKAGFPPLHRAARWRHESGAGPRAAVERGIEVPRTSKHPARVVRCTPATAALALLLSLHTGACFVTAQHPHSERRPGGTSAELAEPGGTRPRGSDATVVAQTPSANSEASRGIGDAAGPSVQTARVPGADCWLWPGAAPRRCDENARVYLLQGHFYRSGRFEEQGPLPGRPPREGRELVPVYRMDRLPPTGVLQAVAAPVIDAWRRRGWRVPGVQVDFDSPTAKLDRYARWVRLENDRFGRDGTGGIASVTGLADWLMSGRPADLRSLTRAAGVIAFMFYHQGRGIEPLQRYIDALARSGLRFRLGLLPAQRHDRRFAAPRAAPGYLGDIEFHGASAARE